MMRTPDGAAHIVPLRRGVALGVTPDAGYPETTFLIPPRTTVLLYTDGLIEDRHHPIDHGLHELCVAVRTAPTDDPDAILNDILANAVGPRPRTDDVALLCLTNDGTLTRDVEDAPA